MRYLFIIGVVIILSGCQAVSYSVPSDNSEKIIAERIMEAIEENNEKLFMAQMRLISGQNFTKADFEKSQREMQKNFGAIINRKFLVELETPVVSNFVWLLTFERVDADNNRIIQDMLFRVVIGPLDGEEQIVSMGFI